MKKVFWALIVALFGVGAAVIAACASTSTGNASAAKVSRREQLIGGPRALAEVGDYKLSNGIIHAVVQEVGHSRGPGAFGGSLIDVDLVRGGRASGSAGAPGNDMFTEMFPAFFLQAVEPSKVEIAADGSDGGPAIIRVSGKSGDFLSVVKGVNDLVLPKGGLDYQVEYILEPGKQYLKIVTSVTNPSTTDPASFALSVPFGFVTLLGEGQDLFVPGKGGFDMRFRLEEVYKLPSALEALPGEVTSMVVTEGDGVSYGLAADERGANYLRTKPSFYPTAERDSLLIPVAAGAFLGTFWGQPPARLEPGETYSYTGYLAVGSGDVASVQKVLHELKGNPVQKISGVVREKGSNMPVVDASVVVQDDLGNYVSAARTLENGTYSVEVAPGRRYRVIALDSIRTPVASAKDLKDYVAVESGKSLRVDLELERPAYLAVTVRDETGRPIPAKVSVEGSYDFVSTDVARSFLYDLRIGERQRSVDLTPDLPNDPQTRRYLERVFFARHGTGGTTVRANAPGQKYRVYASRGIEYDIAYADVELLPGQEKQVALTLRHVMPTPGYISGDFHVHSINSADSYMNLPDRVTSYAVEGVDYLTATDHNYVTDLQPTVEAIGLRDFVKTGVGLELTTIEMGHFNAFPLQFKPGAVTHGSFNWFYRPPGELFAGLRSIGSLGPQKTIVQVNHPRDGIMGYFSAFNLGAYTTTTLPEATNFHLDDSPGSPYAKSNFSFEFDAMEVFNGKHLELLFHYRIPEDPGPGPEPAASTVIPAVGEILELEIPVPDPSAPSGTRLQAQPAFPGALDDYYMLLAQGREFTAMGNSDSHSMSGEAGLPRTYVHVGDAADRSIVQLTDSAVVDGLLAHRTVVTNGPFVEMTVNERPQGSRVHSPDGNALVRLRVEAAPWVDVSEIVIKQGHPGMLKTPKVLATVQVAPSEKRVRYEGTFSFSNLQDRSFLVAEVSGTRSMWPVYTPTEIPSIQINEAVGTLASSFGFEDKFGKYRPQRVQTVRPFAMTSPVWVDRVLRSSVRAPKKVQPLGPAEGVRPVVKIPNLTKLFGQFHGH